MTTNVLDEFAKYLAERHFNAAALLGKLNSSARRVGDKTLRDLWEASDLSANDFAEEVAALLPPAADRVAATDCRARRWRPSSRAASCARRWCFPYQGARRKPPAGARRPDRRWRRCAPPRSCSAGPVAIEIALLRGHRDRPDQAARRGRRRRARRRGGDVRARRRRRREPARSRERRAGRARRQRPARARHGAARDRHPHRAVPHRPCRAHARRRPAARRADAGRRAAAGADLAHQDSRRPQHRRAPPAAGRRGARARRAHRIRRARRHHADAAWRVRRDPPAAARPRPAGDRQARAAGARRSAAARAC